MKAVSVVVPCYNAAQYLDKCIRYLLNQTIGRENLEIILVNDASTDDGKTWCKIMEYEHMFPDVILAVSLEENMRQGGARNAGIFYASGEYLIFCDADDWLLEETLEHCYQAAKKYNADIVEFLIHNVRDHAINVPLEKGDKDVLLEIDTEEKMIAFLMTCSEEFSYGSQKKFYRFSLVQENCIRFAEHLIFEEPSFMVPIRFYEQRHYFLDEKLYICYLSQESTVRSEWVRAHKWDNPQVWMHLVEDLEERGLLKKYHSEIEYLFFSWGFGLTMKMLLRRGYRLTIDDLEFLVDMVLRLFPDVRQNKYIVEIGKPEWDGLLLAILDVEFVEESVQVVNEILKKYL